MYWSCISPTLTFHIFLYPIHEFIPLYLCFILSCLDLFKKFKSYDELPYRCDLEIPVIERHERVSPQPLAGDLPMRSLVRDLPKLNYDFHGTELF